MRCKTFCSECENHFEEKQLKSRTEAIRQDRDTISQLQAKYGLLLRGPDGENLAESQNVAKFSRRILAPAKNVIPCNAELKESGTADPCLIVPSSLPVELLPSHKSVAVGGQVIAIKQSVFALPGYLMDEAWGPHNFLNGQPLPLLVAIRGNYRYLVRPKSCFFKYETFRGCDLDQLSPMEPDRLDLKLNRYYLGSDMTDELTVVMADY